MKDKGLVHRVKKIDEYLLLSGIDARASELAIGHGGETAFGMAYVNENLAGNVLSMTKLVAEGHDVRFDADENRFRVRVPNSKRWLVFAPDAHGMYTAMIRRADLVHTTGPAYKKAATNKDNRNSCRAGPSSAKAWTSSTITTVASNLARCTVREVERARAARSLQARLGFPSFGVLKRMLQRGDISNCDVTSADLERANAIWGTPLPCVKGKTTGHATPRLSETVTTGPKARQVMHSDLMFISKVPFLVSVLKPSQYILATELKRKDAPSVRAAVQRRLNEARGHGVQIPEIRFDRESAVLSLWIELMEAGILPELTAADEVVPAAERAIRLLKERVRTLSYDLPYTMPLCMLPGAVEFSRQRLNMVTSEASDAGEPAHAIYFGRKVDAKTDLRAPFGAYVQAHTASVDSTMRPRTLGCLTLHSAENAAGSWVLMNLNTLKPIVRQVWTELPVPDHLITYVNALPTVAGIDDGDQDLGRTEVELSQEEDKETAEVEAALKNGGPVDEPAAEGHTYLDQPEDAVLREQAQTPTHADTDHPAPAGADVLSKDESPSTPTQLRMEEMRRAADSLFEAGRAMTPTTAEATGEGLPSTDAVLPEPLIVAESVETHVPEEEASTDPPATAARPHGDATITSPDASDGEAALTPSVAEVTMEQAKARVEAIEEKLRALEEREARLLSQMTTEPSYADAVRNAVPRTSEAEHARAVSSPRRTRKRKAEGTFPDVEREKNERLSRREKERLRVRRAPEVVVALKREAEDLLSSAMPGKRRHKTLRIGVRQAIRQYGMEGLKAIVAELLQLSKHGLDVLEPVHVHTLTKKQRDGIIPSFMFVKEKHDASGALEKIKARMVAGGNEQDRSEYSDCSSPTVATEAIFLLAAEAARSGAAVATIDFPGAFLNASIPDSDPHTYVRINRNLTGLLAAVDKRMKQFVKNGVLVCRLKRPLYGCIDASKRWYDHLCEMLSELGFEQNAYDACVLRKVSRTGEPSVTALVHVDDVKLIAESEQAIDEVVARVRERFPSLQEHRGRTHSYLGMEFDYTSPGVVRIGMGGFVDSLLRENDVRGTADTPAQAGLFVDDESQLLTSHDKEAFHSATAKVLYLAKRIRPDLLTAVAFLATRVQAPGENDRAKLTRLLRYLNKTRDMRLELGTGWVADEREPDCASHAEPHVECYVDASFATHANMRSHTGGVVSLGRGAAYATSVKQKLNTKSSTEAELVGVSDVIGQAIWTRNFLEAQGIRTAGVRLHQDNEATMSLLAHGRATSRRSRHIAIKHFFTHDLLKRRVATMVHCSTEVMIADLLTKPLQGKRFAHLRDMILGRAPTAQEP
ncbi:Copia protein [Porphyridium purpureum]|uniref:Copia protein n=1 Tax=Porphyridium purpureum TaxID=35688 RepID=A0A5J4Z3N2_PORPP|nr:Copia protein [Porphyridium purpureum]|eukprot:POR9547..scf295_1